MFKNLFHRHSFGPTYKMRAMREHAANFTVCETLITVHKCSTCKTVFEV